MHDYVLPLTYNFNTSNGPKVVDGLRQIFTYSFSYRIPESLNIPYFKDMI